MGTSSINQFHKTILYIFLRTNEKFQSSHRFSSNPFAVGLVHRGYFTMLTFCHELLFSLALYPDKKCRGRALFCNKDNNTVGNGPRTSLVLSLWLQKPFRREYQLVTFNWCPSLAKKVQNSVRTFSPFLSKLCCPRSCCSLQAQTLLFKLSPNSGRLT